MNKYYGVWKRSATMINTCAHAKSGNGRRISIHCKHRKGSEKMDWIQGIQRAIDYMEENMTEEIDFDKVAQQAYASSFHGSLTPQNARRRSTPYLVP